MAEIPQYETVPAHTIYDDDAVRAIGELFLDCAAAEGALAFMLAELQNHPNKATMNGLAVITGMANKVMLEKISTTIAIVAPQHHEELEPICDKIRGIFEHRNNIAHNTTLMGSGKQIVVVPMKLRPPIGLTKVTYHPAQLRGYCDRLRQLVRHLSERMRAIGVVQTKEYTLPTFVDQECPMPPAPERTA